LKATLLKFFQNPKYIFSIYILAASFSAVSKYNHGPQAYNNYLIFKNVFINAFHQKNIYTEYPHLFFDVNHYGIFFSAIIMPFALMPDWLGILLWNVFNVVVFLYAIKKLPFSDHYKSYFAWLCLQEFITSSVSLQFNVALVGLIILSALYIYEKKETKSAIAILVGAFVKVYGIVGLSQFFFIKNKKKFILSFGVFSILFFCLPMLYSSFHFVIDSYKGWFFSLVEKNNVNADLNSYQDISIMGFFRRIFHNSQISNLYFYAIGLPLFALPYVRVKQYGYLAFRMMILANTLVFLVLFSSSSESPTYIIAVAGVMIWFLMQKNKNSFVVALLILVIIFTCFAMSDLFPRYIKENYIIKYSIKSLPCIVVWLRITYELLSKDFKNNYIIVHPENTDR
jgi:hypothetical protein